VVAGLLLACVTSELPPGRVDGRQWSSDELGLAITFPDGWAIATDPEHFQGGLSGTLLEGRWEQTQVALTWHSARVPGMEQASALDLLHLLAPVVMVRSDPTYRLERIPHCKDAVERRFEGWTQVGLRAGDGLLLLQAWAGTEGLRELVCEHTRWL
jgi:hypothetical protein